MDEWIPVIALMIPIIAIVLGMIVAVLVVVTMNRRRLREIEYRHAERMAAIEKGIELPPEPVSQPPEPPRSRYLLRGLMWLGVGLAITLGIGSTAGDDAAAIGWIPVAVGAAYLLFYAITVRREAPGAAERLPASNDSSSPSDHRPAS